MRSNHELGTLLRRHPLALAPLCVALGLWPLLAPAQPPRTPPINGTVVELRGQQLELDTSQAGRVTVTLAAKLRVIEQVPASLAQVRAGRFVGATAVQQADGRLQATEIHIFPESMRGAGEGHYPMGAPNTTMTNGNVEAVAGNVTVAHDMTLRVDYKGGQSVIEVPRNVSVTLMRAGSRSSLRPGARVTVFAQHGSDHQLSAAMLILHERAANAP